MINGNASKQKNSTIIFGEVLECTLGGVLTCLQSICLMEVQVAGFFEHPNVLHCYNTD